MTPSLITTPDQATPEWVTQVLRADGTIDAGTSVTALTQEQIGTGQVGANIRLRLTYDTVADGGGPPGPDTLVVKFASADPDSAAVGIATGTYETEVAFFRRLADRVDVNAPNCHFCDIEHGTANVVLVFDDLAPATQGDQIAGATVEQAAAVLDQAARLHAPLWGDPSLADEPWLRRDNAALLKAALPPTWAGFVERYGPQLTGPTREIGDGIVDAMVRAELPAGPPPHATVVHGDFRLDNLMFDVTSPEHPVWVVDWQTVTLGLGAQDVAYFMSGTFADSDTRRQHERDLLAGYHAALVDGGVDGYSFDECWDDYRKAACGGLLMAIFASMHVGRTERGDEMFMAMANRSAVLAADHDTLSLLG